AKAASVLLLYRANARVIVTRSVRTVKVTADASGQFIEKRGLGRWGFGEFDHVGAAEIRGAGVDLDHARQAVRLLGGFVPADSFDARETQGVAAGVALRLLDLVAGDLQDDLWDDAADAAVDQLQRAVRENFRELRDLGVGDAAVGFADVDQLRALFVGLAVP